MTKTLEVFRFELAFQLRRASTLVYFLLVLGACTMFLQMMASGPKHQGAYFNAPFAVMVMIVFGSMLALLILAAFAGDAATRDVDARMHALFYTSPVGKRAYVLGRFLGAFALSALLLLALPLGCIIATWMPWVDPERIGPFRAAAHLMPYLFYALPNAFVATAVLFSLATFTRRAIASYAGAAFLFFFAIVCGKLLPARLGWSTAELLDPIGFTTVQALWQSTNALQKNTFAIAINETLLANRLLWLGVGVALLAAAYARFRFAHESVGGERTRRSAESSEGSARVETRKIAMPEARRVFGAATRMRQLLAIAMRSFRELHASRVWWIVPFLALLFIDAAPSLALLDMGIPGPLTTARLAEFFGGDVSILITLLVALSAGELVWRDRAASIHRLADVTPVPDWLPVTGKFLGIAMMLVATHVLFMLAGLAAQAMAGAERYDVDLYVKILFGLQLPEHLLTAALAMVVHVLVNQKYVANVLIAISPIVRDLVRGLGVENDLLLYGSLPKWTHSEISGFGPSVEARLWYTLYFGGWALLFALATYLFWSRGEERGLRQKLALARLRLNGIAATLGVIAIAIIAGAGGFIAYHTRGIPTSVELEQQRAEYERRYGRYASAPKPALTATELHVDFYPERRTATIRGNYRLENRTGAKIDTIHVAIAPGPQTTTVSFDRPSRATLTDDKLGHRIYALGRALQPGESLQMNFNVAIASRPFQAYGTPPVVGNGSVLLHRPPNADHWLPLVGYQSERELNEVADRKKYGLRERWPYPRHGDVPVGDEQQGYDTTRLETIIGTDAGQIGVAPGAMRRTWIENGRRYVHYVTDAPISNAWTITSANYAVHRAKWRDVDIEIFHDPHHTENVGRMTRGVQASLEYYTRQFGPYPYRQLRFVEYPSEPSRTQMTAHSGLVTYAEGFSLIRPEVDPREIDFPFAVAAHEVGHQWWGHQITPARVEGAAFLAESLSWYSGMLVVEETYGREHLQRILGMMREQYLGPNQPRAYALLRTADSNDAYRMGPFVMFALRESVGVETVNRVLRNFVAKFPPGREPYPTTLDFYAELKAATPPEKHGLLKDLFEEITFWDLRAERIDVRPAGNGTHRAVLQVEARKIKGDGTGAEKDVPMNDAVEIALYDANGKPLYRGTHRIRDGAQTLEITVARPPARAEVDPDHELPDRHPEDNAVSVGAE